jgi:glycosyltransferase involved in cell wall biosynthesis
LADVFVIIPALNEAEALPKVLGDLPEVGGVVVVDNGSTDATAAVAIGLSAMVVYEPRRGYGSACLSGLSAIESLIESGQANPEIIAFVDADYGDHPDLLPMIVQPICQGGYDFVLGSRLLGTREPGAMPPQAVWGNRLACLLMRIVWRVRYTDLGPMRAIRLSTLRQLQMCDPNYGWTVEMQIKAARADVRFLEVPVPYRKRVGVSKISGTISGTIRAGYKILATIFRHSLRGSESRPIDIARPRE